MKQRSLPRFGAVCLAIASMISTFSNVLTADDGFKPLFDGKSLAGWVVKGGDAKYTVVNDEIVGNSVKNTGNTFLATEKFYANFDLELDVLVDSELNSGIQIRSDIYDVPKDYSFKNTDGQEKTITVPAHRFHGYQVEIDPSKRAWSGGIYDESRRGWLQNVDGDDKAELRKAFKPGEWNHFRIVADGDSIQTWINGTQIVDLHDAMTSTGRIALQVHSIGDNDELNGKTIRWKNIKIKELPNSTESAGISYTGTTGPGKGKSIVLIAGDEEYRSEEALPQLAKILSERHGFNTQVLFPIDPETGFVNPVVTTNIPGTEALDHADLLILFTRFRALPDNQMEPIDRFLKAGKPVIAIRTATHGFNHPAGSKWEHYANGYSGDKKEWADGFGRLILGERWHTHHGHHSHESTRGFIVDGQEKNPILRGVESGRFWGVTDVYGVRLPLPGDSQPLILGQVTLRAGEFDENDRHFGMRPTDREPNPSQNSPMMPVVWTKTYQVPGGQVGKSLTTTTGAAIDLENDDVRRVLINGVYALIGLTDQIPADGCHVETVGNYVPSAYGFRDAQFWTELAKAPKDFK